MSSRSRRFDQGDAVSVWRRACPERLAEGGLPSTLPAQFRPDACCVLACTDVWLSVEERRFSAASSDAKSWALAPEEAPTGISPSHLSADSCSACFKIRCTIKSG